MKTANLIDCSTPEDVPAMLRRAAEAYYETEGELGSAWQDENAGRVWRELAKILERAADSCERAIDKCV